MELYNKRQHDDFEWFKENYAFLFEKYGACFLAIRNNQVVGSFTSYSEAVSNMRKKVAMGDFIVQECNGNESAYSSYNVTTYSY